MTFRGRETDVASQRGFFMATVPHLQFRPLQPDEKPLALEIAASLDTAGGDNCEVFGLAELNKQRDVPAWGLFIKGELCGCLWYRAEPNANIRVIAITLPRSWWNMGLSEFMMQQVGQASRKDGSTTMTVVLSDAGTHFGEILDDAGFVRQEDENIPFPDGTWLKRLRLNDS